jgi:hypothetical protein
MITDKDMLFYCDTGKPTNEQITVNILMNRVNREGQISYYTIADKKVTSITLFKTGSDKPVTISGEHIVAIEVI